MSRDRKSRPVAKAQSSARPGKRPFGTPPDGSGQRRTIVGRPLHLIVELPVSFGTEAELLSHVLDGVDEIKVVVAAIGRGIGIVLHAEILPPAAFR
jgi:hypothetical protein